MSYRDRVHLQEVLNSAERKQNYLTSLMLERLQAKLREIVKHLRFRYQQRERQLLQATLLRGQLAERSLLNRDQVRRRELSGQQIQKWLRLISYGALESSLVKTVSGLTMECDSWQPSDLASSECSRYLCEQ